MRLKQSKDEFSGFVRRQLQTESAQPSSDFGAARLAQSNPETFGAGGIAPVESV